MSDLHAKSSFRSTISFLPHKKLSAGVTHDLGWRGVWGGNKRGIYAVTGQKQGMKSRENRGTEGHCGSEGGGFGSDSGAPYFRTSGLRSPPFDWARPWVSQGTNFQRDSTASAAS